MASSGALLHKYCRHELSQKPWQQALVSSDRQNKIRESVNYLSRFPRFSSASRNDTFSYEEIVVHFKRSKSGDDNCHAKTYPRLYHYTCPVIFGRLSVCHWT